MKISHPVQLGAHRISWTIINHYYWKKGTVKKAGFLSHRNRDRTYPPKPGLCKGSSKAVPEWTINAGGVLPVEDVDWDERNCCFLPSGYVKKYWKLPFIVSFPIKIVIFHSYVSLPEGMSCFKQGKSIIFSRKTGFFLSWNIFRGCARLPPHYPPLPSMAESN